MKEVTAEIKAIAVPKANIKKFYCSACRTNIEEVVAKFCWSPGQTVRFGGKAYCRACQKKL